MPQTFIHSARHPTILILKMGRIRRFGETALVVNVNNNIPIIQYFDYPEFTFDDYPCKKEIDDFTTCDLIFKACQWFIPYMDNSELTPIYRNAILHLDGIIASIPTHSTNRIELINKLKFYISLGLMPLALAKLEMLMEDEAIARLQWRKAIQIQTKWRDIIANPYHIICQRRLMHEFYDMLNQKNYL